MLWLFIVLQMMTPFIHAHAGVVQLDHASLLHAHTGMHNDPAYHAIAAEEHGAEIEVARGMPSRADALRASPEASLAAAVTAPRIDTASPGAGFSAPPPLYLVRSDHTLPLALAPPSA